eukprot:3111866-Pleurochrysis_carterae.AAC.1
MKRRHKSKGELGEERTPHTDQIESRDGWARGRLNVRVRVKKGKCEEAARKPAALHPGEQGGCSIPNS